jgi:hypothetical protein
MDHAICGNRECGGRLTPHDQFCGDCGMPVPNSERVAVQRERAAAFPEAWTRTAAPPLPPGIGTPFFSHHPAMATRTLSNATRHLCAAAYLSRGFANRVVADLISSRRAIAPSLDIDLGPIVRHCLRARRNLLRRDLLLIAVIVLGLFLGPLSTIAFLAISVALGIFLPALTRRHGGITGKLVPAFGIGIIILIVPVGGFVLTTGSLLSTVALAGGLPFLSSGGGSGITFFVVLILAWVVQFSFMLTTLRTLAAHARQGVAPPSPETGPVEGRISLIEGAQWGNITLYGGEDPFIGAGYPQARHWSIAIKLTPARPARHLTGRVPGNDEYVPVDPVALHRWLRQRLLTLNDPGLPHNERVGALRVTDRLVGSGRLRWENPLVDPVLKTPYSCASADAIDTLIRYPQAGLRYYQQVSVSDEGPPVIHNGRLLLDGVDQGIAVTAFIYAAVEGRMFYLQFVLSVLPPVFREYQAIEHLPSLSSGTLQATAFRLSVTSMFDAVVSAPVGLLAAFRNRLKPPERPSADGLATGDLGAMISVRELGSERQLGNYIRSLDVEKYNRIFERLILESVEDFLAAEGVDTSAFRGGASTIVNGNIIGPISGSNNVVSGRDSVMHIPSGAQA